MLNRYEIQSDVIFQTGDKIDSSYIEFIVQENAKLKAEIERCNDALTTWNNANNEMLRFNQELKDEIEMLKAELEQSVREKADAISKIEYALNECEPIYNKCAFIPQAKPIYDLAMNYCLNILKGKV